MLGQAVLARGGGWRRPARPRSRSRRGRPAPSARPRACGRRSSSDRHSRIAGGLAEAAPDDRRLLADARVVDEDLHQEAVDLGLGQRVGALGLDRVLGRHHDERQRHLVRRSADRDLLLLHHLEQRRLHLGRGAVDLVGEQEVAEHRAELGVEGAGVGTVDARPDEVRGHQVGRELDPAVGAAEHRRQRLDGQRLGQPGDALEQYMAAGEQADEQPLEHRVLPDDHALDLVQRLLQGVARLARSSVVWSMSVICSPRSLSPRRGGRTSAATGRCRAAAAPGPHRRSSR